MSELKRVQLTTVDSSQREKKPKRKAKTFRFELSLGESNAATCPEYSFAELIKNEKPAASDDPFDDGVDMAEVEVIAQRFEAKYGRKSAYSGKKKRTREMDDYYDLGGGYDIDDPFIDNTEAYDEVIPSTLTTKHGGFYINQGQLDFRALSDDSFQVFASPNTTPSAKKKKKKGVLDSDSEEETGEALAKKFKAMKRKRLLESKALEKKKKKHSEVVDGEPVIKKKKKKNPQKLMKKLSRLRENHEAPVPSSPGNVSTPTICTTPTTASTAVSLPSTSATSNGVTTTASQAQVQVAVTTTSSSIISTPALTSVATVTSTSPSTTAAAKTVTNGGDNMVNLGINPEEKSEPVLSETMRDESSSKSGDEGRGEQQGGDKITQLPSQLPADLLSSIESIKKCAKESTEGKCKFFSPEINKLLLEIEIGSYGLAWGSRSAIFSHLGEYLPCGKPALLRRAKKLRETQEEDQLHEPIERLKKAINAVMPALQEQYRQELLKAKAEADKNFNPEGPKEEGSTESEEDETKQDTTSKKPKRPKRKFQWTAESRHCLKEVVTLKVKGYKLFKSRNQTTEEYIKTFLDSVIKPLWPSGWMQTRILMKESKMCYEDPAKIATVQQNKEKIAPPSGKPWPSSTLDTNATTVSSAIPRAPPTQAHVSKTESVIEISSHGLKETKEGPSKEPESRDISTGGGDTVVVHLPGSSPTVSPPTRPSGTLSSIPKLSPPPVEVIDITESPLKSPPLQSSVAQSLTVADKASIAKQAQESQPPKSVSKLHLHQSHQWARQMQPSLPTHSQQQAARSVSTLGGPLLSQTQALQTKAGDIPASNRANNVDSLYQAKVVLKPVLLSQGQQQKGVASTKVSNQPTSFNVTSVVSATSKSGNLPLRLPKSAHLSNSGPLHGPSKVPVSFSQTSPVTSVLGQGGVSISSSSTKLYSQLPQHKKTQAAAGSGSSSSISASPRGPSQQQVRSGIVVGTSNSHPTAHFPHTQAGSKPRNAISYRPPQQPPLGLTSASSRPDQRVLANQGSNRPLQAGAVSPVSLKSSNIQANKSAPIRTMQQGYTSPGSFSRPSSAVPPPNSPKRLLQPEQPSPPSRGSNSCSPQQLSPGEVSPKMTQFEQMQSQIRSQEAMEVQALKNLGLLYGFQGPKSTRPDGPATKPVTSSYTSRVETSSARSPVSSASASDHRGQVHSKLSPSKLHEDLLKLRDSMGGGTQNQHLIGTKPGLGPVRSVAWQLPLSQSVIRNVSDAKPPTTTVFTSKAEPQQNPSLKGQKNIFSEMQKPVYSVESLMQARESSNKSSAGVLTKDVHKGNVDSENASLLEGFGIEKGSISKRKDFNPIESKTAVVREETFTAKSLLEGRTVVGSKNGDRPVSISHPVERKLPTLPEKFTPDKVTGSTSYTHQNKGQGHSGSFS